MKSLFCHPSNTQTGQRRRGKQNNNSVPNRKPQLMRIKYTESESIFRPHVTCHTCKQTQAQTHEHIDVETHVCYIHVLPTACHLTARIIVTPNTPDLWVNGFIFGNFFVAALLLLVVIAAAASAAKI